MELKKEIKKFCKPFGVKIIIDNEDGWACYKNLIYVPTTEKKMYAEGFMDLIEQDYPDITATEFTWSLLHEVGHAKTWDLFTKKAWKKYEKTAPYIHDIEKYSRVPQERVATDWAARYIAKHPKRIAKFEKKIEKILGEIR